MPQLVKGGKHVFGWSRIGPAGGILVPPEAMEEYGLQGELDVFLVSGSKTSGGFSLIREDVIKASPLGVVVEECPALNQVAARGTVREWKGRLYTRTALRFGSFSVPITEDQGYGLRPGDLLLVVRGSGLGPGFIARGPLTEEAHRHEELVVFDASER